MASNTANYNLAKPDGDDFYNIEVFNANADKLDGALKANADALTALDESKADKDGTVASAGKLTAARKIHGVPFDGSADITLPEATQTASGVMSAADKTVVESVKTGVDTLIAGKISTAAAGTSYGRIGALDAIAAGDEGLALFGKSGTPYFEVDNLKLFQTDAGANLYFFTAGGGAKLDLISGFEFGGVSQITLGDIEDGAANIRLIQQYDNPKGGITMSAPAGAALNGRPIVTADANSFTPSLRGSSTAGTISYVRQEGTWRRMGGVVTCLFTIMGNVATAGSGQLLLALPPDLPAAAGEGGGGIVTLATGGSSLAANAQKISIADGAVDARLWSMAGSSAAFTALGASGTAFALTGNFTYFVLITDPGEF